MNKLYSRNATGISAFSWGCSGINICIYIYTQVSKHDNTKQLFKTAIRLVLYTVNLLQPFGK